MYFDTVLDPDRIKLLPLLKDIPSHFYLSGGTGLSLQLGHRISVDFDFFTPNYFDTQQLIQQLTNTVFKDQSLMVIQEAENTLDLIINSNIKFSFFRYPYPLIFQAIQSDYFQVADYRDIAASKMIAIAQRATQKDYFDVYYLLKKQTLRQIFDIAKKKYPHFNPIIYLKALSYFDDCDTASPTVVDKTLTFDKVKEFLVKKSKSTFEEIRSENK